MPIYSAFFRGSRRAILLRGVALIAAIAVFDWWIVGNIPLGFLYLFPMVLVGSVLEPWQIALVAALCAFLAEAFDDLVWNQTAGLSRDVVYFAAFFGAGLFVREVSRNRLAAMQHLKEIERESEARREAEEQLRVLVESNPAAVITADDNGVVVTANEAAHRLLAVPQGELAGRVIHRYLPSLKNIAGSGTAHQFFRAVMQARGQREDGETFLADISFSTYRTNAGLRLAAMVIDASEEFRSHEVSGLHQLLAGSRIAVDALSHEVRNICSAIRVVHQNLSREGLLEENRDFEALGNLIAGLEKIAKLNLRQSASQASKVDLGALLDELRIVIIPMLEEEDIAAEWNVEDTLPPVWADRSSLMQVFLNVVTNSLRALSTVEHRRFCVHGMRRGDEVLIEFSDNGGGVMYPEHLFRPFQDGAQSSGLGLYLSRAFLRSFGGEIRYSPIPSGACFIITLDVADTAEEGA